MGRPCSISITTSNGADHCPPERAISTDYIPRLQLLLDEIDYRYVAPQPPSTTSVDAHHDWIHNTLGPLTSWTMHKLNDLEDSSLTVVDRSYPLADTEMKTLLARFTATAIVIDDSHDNEAMYQDLADFTHRIYTGQSHSSGILNLFHELIKEPSHAHEGDAILRGLAVSPWITFVDACLLEKRLSTVNSELRASPYDMGYHHLAERQHCAAREVSKAAAVEL